MKLLFALLLCLLLSFSAVTAESTLFLYRSDSVVVEGHTIALLDMYQSSGVLLQVDDLQREISVRDRWVTAGPVQLKIVAIYNHLDVDQDKIAFQVRGYTVAEPAVAEPQEVVSEVRLFAGDLYIYGSHRVQLQRTTQSSASLLVDSQSQQIYEGHSYEGADFAIRLVHVRSNPVDTSLDEAVLRFSGLEGIAPTLSGTAPVVEPAVVAPIVDDFNESAQYITVEPTPEEIVFAPSEEAEVVREPVVEEPEAPQGFFSRLFRALFGAFFS